MTTRGVLLEPLVTDAAEGFPRWTASVSTHGRAWVHTMS
jgi:hypothetical protein